MQRAWSSCSGTNSSDGGTEKATHASAPRDGLTYQAGPVMKNAWWKEEDNFVIVQFWWYREERIANFKTDTTSTKRSFNILALYFDALLVKSIEH